MTVKKISPDDLVPIDQYCDDYPITVDLVYAQPDHKDNIFGQGIYRPDARMWGHREIVELTLRAAQLCHEDSGWFFEIKDCLRTTEAQGLMLDTDIVKAHPRWTQEPNRLLSPPGKGGHPRGMAIDIILRDSVGMEIDMGTAFDFLTKNPDINPAARNWRELPEDILKNRKFLESCMMQAAKEKNRELLPLPQEWWDFRFPNTYTGLFEPISDRDLPPPMRMTALTI